MARDDGAVLDLVHDFYVITASRGTVWLATDPNLSDDSSISRANSGSG